MDWASYASASEALARAMANDPINAEQDLGSAAFWGAGPKSILEVIRGQQAREAQRQQLQAERQNLMSKLRAQMAMQGPELDTKLRIAEIAAQKPDLTGLWNLLKAKESNVGRESIQELKGQQSMQQILENWKHKLNLERLREAAELDKQSKLFEQREKELSTKVSSQKELETMRQSGATERANIGADARIKSAELLSKRHSKSNLSSRDMERLLRKTEKEIRQKLQERGVTTFPPGHPREGEQITDSDIIFMARKQLEQKLAE